MGDCWKDMPPSEYQQRQKSLRDELEKMLRVLKDTSLSYFTVKEFRSLLNLFGVETSYCPKIDEDDFKVLKRSIKRLEKGRCNPKGKCEDIKNKDSKKGRKK